MEEVTLLFRHLPAELNVEERKDLLLYLGASHVKVMSKTGPMKNTAFAIFGSKDQATQVLNQLHQAEFLGSKLVIEFAKTQLPISNVPQKDRHPKDIGTGDGENVPKKTENEQKIEPQEIKFDTTFGTWGLKHPRRPNLRYTYPPPTPSILTNVLNALVAVPKFYVQVLHLMNKMDLPAPFGAVTPAPPIRPDMRNPTLPDDNDQLEMDISSETESELESGDESGEIKKVKEAQPKKQLQRALRRRQTKRPRLSDLQESGTTVTPTTVIPVNQVFEMINESQVGLRKIELKLPSSIAPLKESHQTRQMLYAPPKPPVIPHHILVPTSEYDHQKNSLHQQQHLQETTPISYSYQMPALPPRNLQTEQHQLPQLISPYQPQLSFAAELASSEAQDTSTEQDIEPAVSNPGGFGVLQPKPKEDKIEVEDTASKEWTKSKFISSSDLKRSKLSSSEMKELSVFKSYSEGEPSCRLYLKNLAKNVTEEDIHWIYGRYVDWDNELAVNIFDITLMKEGRMKGQAFVTLPTEENAISALKDTNGFILKDKPLVVQFARSAKVKK